VKTALVLIDLQNDFLLDPSLAPAAGRLVERAACILTAARAAGVPVFHIHTLIHSPDDRMPHWKEADRSLCVRGSDGARPPPSLEPQAAERVIAKSFFSGFSNPLLEAMLRKQGVGRLVLAGVHLHACVRSTAVDAYQLGFEVAIAEQAVGSYDALHGEQTRLYLEGRVAHFLGTAEITRQFAEGPATVVSAVGSQRSTQRPARELTLRDPSRRERVIGKVGIARPERISAAVRSACDAAPTWEMTPRLVRAELLRELARRLEEQSVPIAAQIVEDVGKPAAAARAEVKFAGELLQAALRWGEGDPYHASGHDWRVHSRPHGVVALITPWNNPLAIPLGKIVPALLYGNSAVWKPSPAGTFIAERIGLLLKDCGFPSGLVEIIAGDRGTAETIMACEGVDAVSVTGSSVTGYTAQAICARRRIPLQAELGGNNASIVLSDAPLTETARAIAIGAMGFAGQRCTANRRVIVPTEVAENWTEALLEAIVGLTWGDPRDEATVVGPMISDAACDAVVHMLRHARGQGAVVAQPHSPGQFERLAGVGSYHPPTLVVCDKPGAEIVQEETFGPVLVVQPARNWEHALELCNGVRQGLVASLFTASEERQRDFLKRCRAGILKINAATAAVAADPPFCGWGSSAVGPPEHGVGDPMFYTKLQTVYGSS
jgi:acyl-CoA reductase-like NAD-dependent aldehyde dehydrogenase/nicotinamidase-related amidase